MFRALLKKQLMEVNIWLLQNKKTGAQRSKWGIAGLAVLYAALFASIGGFFYFIAGSLCQPLAAMGLGWLYFDFMGLMALVLGVFGSVFNTYATLYQARDNVLLLSLPIPPRYILIVRLLGVWLWSFLYEAIVFIPTLICWWVVADGSFLTVLSGLALMFAISLVTLTLSCMLGWVVAAISIRMKNKSFVTVLASLLFIAGYYYVYFRASELLKSVLANAASLSIKIRGFAYPLYLMGRAGEGDGLALLGFSAMAIVLLGIVCFVMSKSFLGMAAKSAGTTAGKGKKAVIRRRTVGAALVGKELQRFTSSATYMLNCGLGTLLLPIAAVALLIKADYIRELVFSIGLPVNCALEACAITCMMASMNDITAPSVSLEGKNLWLLQSLPVAPWEVLKAKLRLHLLVTLPPVFLCGAAMIVVFRPDLLSALAVLVLPALFVVLQGAFGLTVNLLSPNLEWTDEVVPVKQSVGVLLSMMGGWALVIALGGVYWLLKDLISVPVYLAFCLALLLGMAGGLLWWLKNKGTKLFAAL